MTESMKKSLIYYNLNSIGDIILFCISSLSAFLIAMYDFLDYVLFRIITIKKELYILHFSMP